MINETDIAVVPNLEIAREFINEGIGLIPYNSHPTIFPVGYLDIHVDVHLSSLSF